MRNGQLENTAQSCEYLFGSNDFFWGVWEDKTLFLRISCKRGLNALMFLKLEIDGIMLNIRWDLPTDINTKYM